MKIKIFLLFLVNTQSYALEMNSMSVIWGEKNRHSSKDTNASYTIETTKESIIFQVTISDDQIILSDSPVHSDHIEIWLALPENKYTDQPQGFKYSKSWNSTYWIEPSFGNDILTMSGDHIQSSPNWIDSYFSEGFFSKKTQWFGIRHIGILPKLNKAVSYDVEKTPYISPQAADQDILVNTQQLSLNEYRVRVEIPLASFGILPVEGLNTFRYLVDVIDIDDSNKSSLLSSSEVREWGQANSFNLYNAISPLQVGIEKIFPRATNIVNKKYLLSAIEGYLTYSDGRWENIQIGISKTLQFNDLFDYRVADWASKYEANITKKRINYEQLNLNGYLIEKINNTFFINGEEAFKSNVNITDLFTVDDVITYIEKKSEPFGKFSKGPCAGASTHRVNIITFHQSKLHKYPLFSTDDCSRGGIFFSEEIKPIIGSMLRNYDDNYEFSLDKNKKKLFMKSNVDVIEMNFSQLKKGTITTKITENESVESIVEVLDAKLSLGLLKTEGIESYLLEKIEYKPKVKEVTYDCPDFNKTLSFAYYITKHLNLRSPCSLRANAIFNDLKKNISLEKIQEQLYLLASHTVNTDESIRRQIELTNELITSSKRLNEPRMIELGFYYFESVLSYQPFRLEKGRTKYEFSLKTLIRNGLKLDKDKTIAIITKYGNADELLEQSGIETKSDLR